MKIVLDEYSKCELIYIYIYIYIYASMINCKRPDGECWLRSMFVLLIDFDILILVVFFLKLFCYT
jgi:hypothetical protein